MNQKNIYTSTISVAEFREFMFDRIVPIGSILESKGKKIETLLPYWRKHNVIPFVLKGLKFEISFAQLFWLRILDQLRQFSYTIKNTQKVCDYFFKDAYYNDLPKLNMRHNQELLHEKKLKFGLSEDEENTLRWIEDKLKDERFIEFAKYDINYLTNLITLSLDQNEQAGILIFLDGEVMEHLGDYYFNHNDKKIDCRKPHLYFSISYLLEEFIEQEELQSLLLPQILNDEEKLVLKEIRTSNVKELLIKKKDSGELSSIYSISFRDISAEEVRNIKKIIGLGNYEEVTLTTRNEKTISFKKTKKQIFR